MPPKRQAASKRKADAVDDDAAAAAASPKSKAAATSTKKRGSKGGAKAARKTKDADPAEEDGSAGMDDAAPLASSSSAAAAAAAPAAPKLKGKAAKLAAALASSAAAPINRCDADSLSLVFSFLNTCDFLSSIAVSRSLRAARLKHTAWPKLNLDSFIQSLRDDNYNDNARRRLDMHFEIGSEHPLRLGSVALGRSLEQVRKESLRISQVRRDHAVAVHKATKAGAPLPQLPADLTALLTTPAATGAADSVPSMWRHVTDIRLRVSNSSLWGDGVCDFEVALHQLTLFPYASAININAGQSTDDGEGAIWSSAPRTEQVKMMYEKLAEAKRVQAMLLFSITRPFLDGLPLLASTLRVLVLDRQPSASIVASLLHLAYLHFECNCHAATVAESQSMAAELGMAIRWLSVSHSLRSLSVARQGIFYSAGLGFVLMPSFIAGATPEQGGPTGETHSKWAVRVAEIEAARPADSTLPRVDWSKPCGLTDITLTAGLASYQLGWISRLPLMRLELGSAPGPRLDLPDPTAVMQPVSCFAGLQMLRLELSNGYECSGFMVGTLRQCNKLRVLQISSTPQLRWRAVIPLKQTALVNLLRANAGTLEELRIGPNLPVEWDPPEPEWALGRTADAAAAAAAPSSLSAAGTSPTTAAAAAAATSIPAVSAITAVSAPSSNLAALAAREWSSLLACTQLRVVELVHRDVPPGFLAALACLPLFHTLELTLPSAQFRFPSILSECINHSRSWTTLGLSLHEESALNLLRISGGLAKLMPPEQLSEAAVSRLRVIGFKDGKRQVLAVQTDKKGLRRWASIEGPFATAVV